MSKNNQSGIREIAKLANVSIGTVDRVIHHRKGVSDATRKKINQLIDKLDYQPNKMASLLASKKTLNIAILIPKVSVETDYWTFPLNGIKQAADEIKQFGVKIQYNFYDLDSQPSFTRAADKMLKTKPDAILLAPSFVEESIVLMEKIQLAEIPTILINSDLPQKAGLTYIGPDLYQSGRLAAQLISKCIATKAPIMVINLSTDLENDHHLIKKVQGFKKYFKDQALTNEIHILNIDQLKPAIIEKSVLEALDQHKHCKAIFVTNSRVNIIAKILKKHKKEIFLIGYDFLAKNIKYLVDGQIDFLIGQRPKEQGYLGIMILYKYLYNIGQPEEATYMPIDIITKENYQFYNS